jgi:hypothetical protein
MTSGRWGQHQHHPVTYKKSCGHYHHDASFSSRCCQCKGAGPFSPFGELCWCSVCASSSSSSLLAEIQPKASKKAEARYCDSRVQKSRKTRTRRLQNPRNRMSLNVSEDEIVSAIWDIEDENASGDTSSRTWMLSDCARLSNLMETCTLAAEEPMMKKHHFKEDLISDGFSLVGSCSREIVDAGSSDEILAVAAAGDFGISTLEIVDERHAPAAEQTQQATEISINKEEEAYETWTLLEEM